MNRLQISHDLRCSSFYYIYQIYIFQIIILYCFSFNLLLVYWSFQISSSSITIGARSELIRLLFSLVSLTFRLRN